MKQIAEYKNKDYSSTASEMRELDYYGCDFPPTQELEKLYLKEANIEKYSRSKSLIKRLSKK